MRLRIRIRTTDGRLVAVPPALDVATAEPDRSLAGGGRARPARPRISTRGRQAGGPRGRGSQAEVVEATVDVDDRHDRPSSMPPASAQHGRAGPRHRRPRSTRPATGPKRELVARSSSRAATGLDPSRPSGRAVPSMVAAGSMMVGHRSGSSGGGRTGHPAPAAGRACTVDAEADPVGREAVRVAAPSPIRAGRGLVGAAGGLVNRVSRTGSAGPGSGAHVRSASDSGASRGTGPACESVPSVEAKVVGERSRSRNGDTCSSTWGTGLGTPPPAGLQGIGVGGAAPSRGCW